MRGRSYRKKNGGTEPVGGPATNELKQETRGFRPPNKALVESIGRREGKWAPKSEKRRSQRSEPEKAIPVPDAFKERR